LSTDKHRWTQIIQKTNLCLFGLICGQFSLLCVLCVLCGKFLLSEMASELNIAIIGIGRLGGALALALSKKGYEIDCLISRSPETAGIIAESITPKPEILALEELEKISSDVIFITTPDPEIQKVAENLAGKLKHQPFVFHTSGSLSSEILRSLGAINCPIGSLHPLVSISDSRFGAERFKDAFFCVEGEPQAVSLAEKIVADLGGKSFSIATQFKPLYHAAAVTASGHLVALFSIATEMLAACGLSESAAQEILFPLVNSTIENLSAQTPVEALTGTFARADVETLKRHLTALRQNVSIDDFNVYLQLGMRSLHLAQEQGADAEKLEEMHRMLGEN
jgi:predicted short-subunit dehydrogenase-like oxidoreductase (DUF2520 family)